VLQIILKMYMVLDANCFFRIRPANIQTSRQIREGISQFAEPAT